jgi:cation diffusion facilitator family transporter
MCYVGEGTRIKIKNLLVSFLRKIVILVQLVGIFSIVTMHQHLTHESNARSQRRAALLSLAVGFAMLAMKTGAYFITHSAAIFSDALESIVHVAATAMALYSVILSSRPADKSHPYGHGKIEFFSAGIEGGLIVVAAIAIIYEAVRGLVFGRELAQLDIGMALTLAAAVINLALGWFLIRRGKQTNSLTLVADGKHVLTDSWTSFGVVAGLFLVTFTGIEILDPLLAIAVALNILFSGYQLMRVSIGGLMDESDTATLHRVAATIAERRTPEWITVHHLRVLRSGQMLHVDFHITIPFYWTVERAHEFEHTIGETIALPFDHRAKVLVHLDPCKPVLCSSCRVAQCAQRRQPFSSDLSWTVESLTGGVPY